MPSAPAEQLTDLRFPLNGIDLYMAYSMQRVGTTPVGKNVRAFEPSTERARGGSRPGLSKWIPPQLPSGTHLVQHLNVIVDPTPAALGDQDLTDPTAVEDPSTNPAGSDPTNPNDRLVRNRRPHVRKGGHGWTRNRYTKPKTSRRFIQQGSVSLIAPFGDESQSQYSYSLGYPNPLTTSSLLVMVLWRNGQIAESDQAPTIVDSAGTTLTLAGHATLAQFNNSQLWMWYGVNTHGAVANTGTFTVYPGAFTTFENDCFAVLEYGGFQTAGPLDAVTSGTGFNVGSPAVNAPNDMVLGAFGAFIDVAGGDTLTPSTPYKTRSSPTGTSGANFWQGLIVCDHIDVQASEGPTISDTNGASGTAVGVVATFKAF